ncbi:VOC family protein [Streptomyces violaceusniger]|uniref:Putative 2,3-dihydroxybiphenyl-1,2-dioxygenase or glyoxalase/bleomycin resistance protein n=1 Tax=Streptomyces violaceusniger TaxID=68280 RepID=A0A4D4KL79_STRVO|nr:putative 2,3-dihydroxybiphenyl-1,2-dioxygenase or glyoxalase/bleomycin resistance protein [Streptomyces violaceusniger]
MTPDPRAPDPPASAHHGLHCEDGARQGEHPGRARNPLVKVRDLAWLRFEKPDLDRAETFARDFGFTVSERTVDELRLRGTFAGTDAIVIRKGSVSRFVGPVFQAEDRRDLDTLVRQRGARLRPLGRGRAGSMVDLVDPSGVPVGVVHGADTHTSLPGQRALTINAGAVPRRINAAQRPPREPALVQRLGHVVLETPRFRAALDWYLETLGLIVSDFLFLPGQRQFGPTMAFLRCDRGSTPADHHTLAMHLGPGQGYVHSAYQVTDLDAVAAGGEYLGERGYRRSWGIGRHIQGSQIFDYWRDPDRLVVEHFADGDLFDAGVETGWAPMSASGLAQWGPPVTREFLGTAPTPAKLREVYSALRADDTELTAARLLALMKAMSP